jgi:hypothetical protein
MDDRLHELFLENRQEHGVYSARKMAIAQRLTELIDELYDVQLTTEEKLDKIVKVLDIMNMRDV